MLPAMDFDELNDAMARSNARARRGPCARLVDLHLDVGTDRVPAFLYVLDAPCAGMCPMFIASPGPITLDTVITVGLAGLAVGLVWMWQILRADRDPDSRHGGTVAGPDLLLLLAAVAIATG